jgi:hypothetical protein
MERDASKARGGYARAEAMTPEERAESARRAAQARWNADIPKATHGSPDHPLMIGELEIPCYVLEDGRRVLHQRGMVSALGMSRGSSGGTSGDRLAKFVAGDRLKPFLKNHLITVTETPIKFTAPNGKIAYGYEATVLADICEAVLAAREAGVLQAQQLHIAQQCEILVRGFARVGIIALVDEATGYEDDRPRLALAKILEAFVAKEFSKWVKTFPLAYFTELCRLKDVPFSPNMQLPRYFGRITNNIVYGRLAPGVLAELRDKNPVVSGRRRHKHFQWLTQDIGHPKLLQHLGSVVTLMKLSPSYDEFKEKLDKIHPPFKALPLFDWADRETGADPEDG